MDRTTDEAIAEVSPPARNPAEADRLAERAFRHAERHRRTATAASITLDYVPEQGRRIVDWLVDWHEPAIDGIVDLVSTGRVAGDDAANMASEPRQPRTVVPRGERSSTQS